MNKEEIRVIVAGSRSITDYNYVKKHLDNIFSTNPIFVGKEIIIISGTAAGVDTMGENYAEERGLSKERYPADWKNLNVTPCIVKRNKYGSYNALAGLNRNAKMQQVADAAIVLWDGVSTGSKDMITKMNESNKPVIVIVNDKIVDV